MKTIAQGAEAKIILDKNTIIKNRIPKTYRIPELDKKIRSKRTRAEAKIIEKASKIIPTPKLIEKNLDDFAITLEYINGEKLSENLDALKNKIQICKLVGQNIAKLHKENIIHGDLTTSNMILNKKSFALKNQRATTSVIGKQKGQEGKAKLFEIFFIDFGLSFISQKLEDKAVDLHLLRQALEAKHHKYYGAFWKAVKTGYVSKNKESKKILERLKAVEKRGRYKH